VRFPTILRRTLRWVFRLGLAGGLVALGWFLHAWLNPVFQMEAPRPIETMEWTGPGPTAPVRGLIPYPELLKALPVDWPGWELQEPPYGTLFQHQAYAYTMARQVWVRPPAQVEIRVLDVRSAPFLVESLTQAVEFREEATDHYRRGIRTPDYYGFEAFYFSEGRGEIQVVVGRRLWVSLDGYSLPSPDALWEGFRRVNIRRLQALAQRTE
jgi:hypothetical protein